MNAENIEDIYELSHIQQGLLFHTIADPHSGVYFEQLSIKLQGNLNISAFQKAWQTVVNRHPILRTAFYWEELEQPYQVVYRQVELAIAQQDWRKLSTAEQEQQLEIFLKSDREQGFDLCQAPLLRLALLQIADNTYYFVRSHHHIILEGWSWSLLWNEINSLYHAYCEEKTLNLAPVRPYRDYITWLQQQDLAKAEAFWRQQLQGFTTPTPLVVDRIINHPLPNSAAEDNWRHLNLSATTTTALQSFARQHQLTLNVLLQGAFALLLSRYSGETDIVFGITTSARPPELSGVESIVGLFLNTLPLRIKVASDAFIVPWLQQLQAQLALISEYEYAPLLEIQKWSEIPRSLPLFESILVFNNYPVDEARSQLSESIGASNYQSFEKTNYPLNLVVKPGQELRLEIAYDPWLFEEEVISRLLGHLKNLLENIPVNSTGKLRDLPLLTAPEKQQLLIDWNNTRQDYPQSCIHQLFEAQVEQSPNAIAVVFEDQKLTYQQLNQQANQLANYLQRLGVQPNDLVGICVERSLSMLVGLLGILKAGCAYVPLDPAYPQERLTFMLEDAKVSLLITDQSFWINNQLETKILYLNALQETIAQESVENPQSNVNSDNLAYVIYTSGSTGKPKGVLIPHSALTNCLIAFKQKLGLFGGDTFLSVTTLSFDIAALELYLPLILGDRLIIASREVATDGTQLLKLIQSSGATVMQATPATWYMLLAAGWEEKQFLKILCGGEALSRELANQLLARCDTLWNVYGPTETTIWSAACQVELGENAIAIGGPIANTQFYILDQHLQPVPIGVPGELYIGGTGLAVGYLNRPELTAERFINHEFKGQNSSPIRLYKTGDLVRYLPDGNIEYLGRIDHQIKLRGFRIELGEIEQVLSQHSALQQAVVVAREDKSGDKRLVAYVVSNEKESSLNLHSLLHNFLAEKLPSYMIPSAFVALEALPLTPNGKVDRKNLPAPDFTQIHLKEGATIPLTPIQEMLTGIWQQILEIEQISIHDNFFELGGHSLLATRVISQIRSTFKVELPLRILFELPTIANLSQQIEAATKAGLGIASSSIKPVTREKPLPLSFAQARLWFIDQLDTANSSYNLFAAVRLTGEFKLAILEQSLNKIIKRHEILRTNFVEVDGQTVQVISPKLTLTIPVIKVHQKQEIQELAIAEANKPFNLSKDPLLRLSFLEIEPTEGVLLLTMHHIISDGWSMGLLLQEITTLYQAFSLQKPSPMPELPIQYADFAVWQRQWLSGEVLQTQLNYWQQQLGNNLPILNLPTDRPRPSVQSFRGARKTLVLSPQLTKNLKALSTTFGSTLFMTLLAVFKILLHYSSGQNDIIVGTDVANRNRSETEGLIGFFVNQLVLRTDVGGNPSFPDLLTQIRQITLDAYAHQDLPFDKLVEAINPQRDLSRTTLFQVKFVLQNAPMPPLEFSGLALQPLEVDKGTSRFDLLLNMMEMEQGLVTSLEYNTDLFNESTIATFLSHFERLLDRVVSNPDVQLNELKEFLAAADEQQRNVKEEVYQESVRQKLMRVKRKSVMG
jgi:amino acid adenylation domain-containing protein